MVAFTIKKPVLVFANKQLPLTPKILCRQLGMIVEFIVSSMNDPFPIAILYRTKLEAGYDD